MGTTRKTAWALCAAIAASSAAGARAEEGLERAAARVGVPFDLNGTRGGMRPVFAGRELGASARPYAAKDAGPVAPGAASAARRPRIPAAAVPAPAPRSAPEEGLWSRIKHKLSDAWSDFLDSRVPNAYPHRDYQLGDEWGKKPVKFGTLAQESAVFQRAARATAGFGRGTAFYLGRFNGHHLMATNHHVMDSKGCADRSAEFVLLGRSFPCEKVYGEWTDVDLALFSIRVAPEEETALAGLGRGFAFDADIHPGQELLTVGFGIADNPMQRMVANRDSDCRVLSGRNDFRFMSDPDGRNPGPDKVWSFASGCDVSHGDSGSAFVDRRTGEVLGLVWTTRVPKSPEASSSKHLEEAARAGSSEVWTQMSYAVPAAKIRERLASELGGGSLGADEAATLKAVAAQ